MLFGNLARGGQKPAYEHTPQTESLLSGYTLNRSKISYNCAPMLNITVICHLIQGKDQGCCQQGGFRWGVRQSELTIFRIKSLLDKSLTREKRKIRVTKKDNAVNKPRQRDLREVT